MTIFFEREPKRRRKSPPKMKRIPLVVAICISFVTHTQRVFAQEREDVTVHTVASFNFAGGRRVAVAVVTGSEALVRLEGRQDNASVTLTVAPSEIARWADRSEVTIGKRIAVEAGDSVKTYGPKLGDEGDASAQLGRLTTHDGVQYGFSMEDPDGTRTFAMLSASDARHLIAALRRAASYASRKTGQDK